MVFCDCRKIKLVLVHWWYENVHFAKKKYYIYNYIASLPFLCQMFNFLSFIPKKQAHLPCVLEKTSFRVLSHIHVPLRENPKYQVTQLAWRAKLSHLFNVLLNLKWMKIIIKHQLRVKFKSCHEWETVIVHNIWMKVYNLKTGKFKMYFIRIESFVFSDITL